jgi:hypothetical protein
LSCFGKGIVWISSHLVGVYFGRSLRDQFILLWPQISAAIEEE